MKYEAWSIASENAEAVKKLRQAGYGELTARVLSARGYETPELAQKLLSAEEPLIDPYEMKEMDRAVDAIRSAMARGVPMAVFGDYDVDGITATCLLTEYLRSKGADCAVHIPGRIEEGYGLNAGAIRQLYEQGVRLIITVDCGITAVEEAELCRRLGITLVITDHHECKDALPQAAAVIDPHRPDSTYPHTGLCGVGIAFKLVAALEGDQEHIAQRYCDLFCLGTIADVMPLSGENRRLVVMGLEALQQPRRLGMRALIEACDCADRPITASTIGYVLAPRINAAGRMERAELAVELFLTSEPKEARELAEALCRMNRERQSVELEIYREASAELKKHPPKNAIVLAGENWHQGVVGIVASRLCEEYCLPTFLICLSGEHGKASSRSYGGLNLFAALMELSDLLEGFGGHELAAGFTIRRKNIDEFRRGIYRCAERHFKTEKDGNALQIDCELTEDLITEENTQQLAQLEPCGTGCAKPIFCLTEAVIERISTIGNGKHLRLRLRTKSGNGLHAIFFSAGAMTKKLLVGEYVDVAFHLNINEYHGMRSLQLTLLDLRKTAATALYESYCRGETLNSAERSALRVTRADVTAVWNYLTQLAPCGTLLHSQTEDLCSAIAQQGRCSLRRVLPCLDILSELGLLSVRRERYSIELRVLPNAARNPLENSSLFRNLRGD